MIRILKMAALSSVLFVGAVGAAPTNELAGTVRDVCGAVLPGTSVSAANGLGSTARVFTDERGHYSLTALAPGQWTIAFEMLGFDTLQQSLLLPENGEPTHHADGFRSYTHPSFTLAPDQPRGIDLPLERVRPARVIELDVRFLDGDYQ